MKIVVTDVEVVMVGVEVGVADFKANVDEVEFVIVNVKDAVVCFDLFVIFLEVCGKSHRY